MKELRFRVAIHATKQKVWDTLWQDETFRQWAGIIDPGTYMVGDLKEGNEVQFISGNGYGVTSSVEKLKPGEFLLFRHQIDTEDSGKKERKKEWTGGKESYSLNEKNGITTVIVVFDAPPGMEKYFMSIYPKVLDRVKELAERGE